MEWEWGSAAVGAATGTSGATRTVPCLALGGARVRVGWWAGAGWKAAGCGAAGRSGHSEACLVVFRPAWLALLPGFEPACLSLPLPTHPTCSPNPHTSQITVVGLKFGAWGLQRYGAQPVRVDALQHSRCAWVAWGGVGGWGCNAAAHRPYGWMPCSTTGGTVCG